MRYTFLLLLLCLLVGAHTAQAQCSTEAVVTNVTCFGLSNGSINLNNNVGTAPFTYVWSNNQTDEDISGLVAGTYTCTVTDALSCVTVVEALVTESPALSVSALGGTLTCITPSLVIQTTVTGGTPPYAYAWSNSVTTGNPVVNIPGTYTVTITDALGCTATAQTIVNQDTNGPTCSILPPDILTCYSPTIALDASCGGGGNFTYQWTTTSGNIVSGANSAIATVDEPGTYALVAVNSVNGCTSQSTVFVTQDQNQPIANAGPDMLLTCTNPSLQLNGSGSSVGPQFSYFWSGPAIFSGHTTLTPTVGDQGLYSLIVTNIFNGCTATDDMLVTFLGTFPVADAGPDMGIPCGGGAVTLTSAGSSGSNLIFLWSGPGINAANQDEPNPVVGLAGTYSLTVTNAQNGCTANDATTVFPGPVIPAQQFTVTPVLCFGGNTGAIDLSVNFGTPPYVFNWGSGVTTEDRTNLTAGTYTVTVDDATTCNYYAQVNVTQPPQLNLGLQKTNNTCNGAANGTINLSVNGATQPYNFLWSNGHTAEDLNNLVAGTYTCTVTDANGCTRTTSATITQPAAIVLSYTVVNVQCNGAASGIIDLTISGGALPYTYDWSNDGPEPIDNDPQDWLNILAGTYTVTVTDANGCTKTISATLTQPPPFVLNPASIQPNCLSADGAIDLSPSGGVVPYNYVWSTGANTQDLTNVPAGTYTVTVVDANFCPRIFSLSLSDQGLDVNAAITPINCFGSSDGSINLDVTGGGSPFTFVWTGPNGYTSNTEDPTGLNSGDYMVSITSATGCVAIGGPYLISQPQQLSGQIGGTMRCFGANDGQAIFVAFGGTSPYTYLWSNGETLQHLSGLSEGIYIVTVTDALGCSIISQDIMLLEPAAIEISFTTLYSNCESTVVAPIVVGGSGGYQFAWNNGVLDSLTQFFTAGDYTLSITDDNSCVVSANYTAQIPSGYCSLLQGRIYQDTLENCQFDTEPSLSGWILRAEGTGGTFYGVSNSDGTYSIDVVAGDYSIFITPPNPLWIPCWPSIPVGTVQVDDTLGGFDFPVKIDLTCPLLTVDISSSNLRRCFSTNYYQIQYCNTGTALAQNAYVTLDLDDFLAPLSSSLPYTDLGNGLLRFDVGDLDVGECGWFFLYVKVSCEALLGQTHCTEAHIYPDDSCLPIDPQWSGASLRLSSECLTDSLRFRIENVGGGNMTNALEYIIIEDQVMLMSAPVLLDAGEFVTVSVPANGSSWRLEVEQVPFHPGESAPAVSVEGCTTGTTFSTGFVTQFSADDADEFVDIDCKENTGSYDPNDKQAFPKGYGAQHYIRPGTPLEYQIRFQNTGNDTAFTVIIVDTLSIWLDPITLRPGASSHPYTWDLTGTGVLSFLFENILLPDSNVNESLSHGFVKFTIDHKANAPLETVIENTAEIYFDFNDAIVTNTTSHRLGENFITVGLWQPEQPEYEVLVSPNPFSDAAILEVKGLRQNTPLYLQVFDLQGKLQMEMDSDAPVFQLKKGRLAAGLYLFKIEQGGVTVGNGKLVIQD
ncbi:MAG: T9SS type A sorting domain-containing protein [Saprospiraceae bacterium]